MEEHVSRETLRERHPRLLAGVDLARERMADFRALGGGIWEVPSSSGGTYRVDYRSQECTCPDYQYRHRDDAGYRCKHIIAVGFVLGTTAECAGCGNRFRHRDLHEVVAGDPRWAGDLPLSYFEGDLLCDECFEGAA